MSEITTDSQPQHGDTNAPVLTANEDPLDSAQFRGAIAQTLDKVRTGEIAEAQPAESPNQSTEDTRDDSRGSEDSYLGTDEDLSEGSHVWDADASERIDEDEGTTAADDDEGGEAAPVEDDDEGYADPDEEGLDLEAGAEDDDGGELEDGADDQVGDTLTAKDRQEIRKDPRLQRMARGLQKDYTEKTMKLQDERRELTAQATRHRRLETTLSTPQGMANYMANVMEVRPDVAAAAFGTAMTGEEQIDVLTEIGLGHPKVIDQVVEKLETLRSDKDAMRNHKLSRDLKQERQQVQVERIRLAAQETDRQTAQLEGRLEREMRRARIPKAWWKDISGDLQSAIRNKVRKDGSIEFTATDVQALVAAKQEDIDRYTKRATRIVQRQAVRKGQKDAKTLARKGKRPRRAAPRSRAPSKPASRRPGGARKNETLGQAIRRELGSHLAT